MGGYLRSWFVVVGAACQAGGSGGPDASFVTATGVVDGESPSFAKAYYGIVQGPQDAEPRLVLRLGPLGCAEDFAYIRKTHELDQEGVEALQEQTFPDVWWDLVFRRGGPFGDAVDLTLGWDSRTEGAIDDGSSATLSRRSPDGEGSMIGVALVGNGSLTRSQPTGPLAFRVAASYFFAELLDLDDLEDIGDGLPTNDVVVEGEAAWCQDLVDAHNSGLPTAPNEDSSETEETDPETEDSETGGPSAWITPTSYSYRFQVGINSAGKSSDFQVDGALVRSALKVTFSDERDRSCGFSYIFGEGRAMDAPAVSSFVDSKDLLGALEIRAGNYTVGRFLDDDGEPCGVDYPGLDESAEAVATTLLLNEEEAPSSLLAGISNTPSPDLASDLEDFVDNGTLTPAEAEEFASGWINLPEPFEFDGTTGTALECLASAVAVDAEMNVTTTGGATNGLKRSTWAIAGGKLKSAVYICQGRVVFGL